MSFNKNIKISVSDQTNCSNKIIKITLSCNIITYKNYAKIYI